MVKLFHHYETQTNRIFLLLEHVNGGKLVGHVSSIRSCCSKGLTVEADKNQVVGKIPEMTQAVEQISDKTCGHTEAPVCSTSVAKSSQECDENDEHIENLLEQLTSIVPPTNPVTASLSTVSADSEEEEEDKRSKICNQKDDVEEFDELDHLKKQLAELVPGRSENGRDEGEMTTEDSRSDVATEGSPLHNEDGLDVINTPHDDASDNNSEEEDSTLSELRKHLVEFTTMPIVNDVSSNLESVQTTDSKIDNGNGIEVGALVPTLDSDGACGTEKSVKKDLIENASPLSGKEACIIGVVML